MRCVLARAVSYIALAADVAVGRICFQVFERDLWSVLSRRRLLEDCFSVAYDIFSVSLLRLNIFSVSLLRTVLLFRYL